MTQRSFMFVCSIPVEPICCHFLDVVLLSTKHPLTINKKLVEVRSLLNAGSKKLRCVADRKRTQSIGAKHTPITED